MNLAIKRRFVVSRQRLNLEVDVGNVAENFGRNFSRLLRISGYTQTDLAEKLGVERARVSDWSRGKHLPRVQHWDPICKYLKCSYSDLVADPDNPPPRYEDLIRELAELAGLLKSRG
jgi:transcriptional regulator with XRE-family HTH domain